jgi:SAM-dependent methyltransferase
MDTSGLQVDLNHPLAQYPMTLEAKLAQVLHTSEEHGGHCNDIAQAITEKGPGLQAIRSDVETDFFSGAPFKRESDQDDATFYRTPRLVNHIDGAAMKRVTEIYTRFIGQGTSVLDLMSSWNSHLPDSVGNLNVIGLGLNREEMERNQRLTDVVVHDLNHSPELPFKQAQFDNVICTVSVEYLTRPVEVFQEVARVLKPGGYFIVTFSERWFPPKVVTLWTELHPFERIGLVLEYFRRSGRFLELQTESIRGLLRPDDDKYAAMTPLSDPVYAVWGKAIPG